MCVLSIDFIRNKIPVATSSIVRALCRVIDWHCESRAMRHSRMSRTDSRDSSLVTRVHVHAAIKPRFRLSEKIDRS